MITRFALLLAAGLLVCGTAAAESFELIGRTGDFVSTGGDNSLTRERGLFRVTGREGKKKLVTDSELINIHSHYRRNRSNTFTNYTYTGEMRILEPGGGVGVTFYSKYPKSDTYYRLRMFGGGAFHIEPHPDGEYSLTGDTDSGVTPEAGVWHKFRVIVRTFKNRTTIKAKVWPAGSSQPRQWQIDCQDAGDNRIKRGKPGVWSMADGGKEWRKLVVTKR